MSGYRPLKMLPLVSGRLHIGPQAVNCFHIHHVHSRIEAKADMHLYTAYWIAFGPHGPRSLPPPGENLFILKWVSISIGVSLVLFMITRQFARPAPKTMNAQYQEMTNEYLRVSNAFYLQEFDFEACILLERTPYTSSSCFSPALPVCLLIIALHRTKTPNPSLVSHQKATKAKAWCKADR